MSFSTIGIIFFIATLIVLIYSIVILIFIFSWMKMKKFIPQSKNSNTALSVIIAARNEENNIFDCLSSVLSQEISSSRFEVIAVNDHSTDSTKEVIDEFISKNKNIKYIELEENEIGKKAAIRKGIALAANELMMMTDADCTVGSQTLTTVISFFETRQPDLILLPVLIKTDSSFFSKIQALESLSLLAVTGASANLNAPLMCNGAGMVYQKKTFNEINGFAGNLHFPSGDDMMILQKIRSLERKNIHFLFSDKALVETKPILGLKAFFDQRVRWTSKTKHYSDKRTVLLSVLVFLASLSLVFTGLSGLLLLNECLLFWAGSLLIFKAIFDFLFLFLAAKSFKRLRLMVWFVPMQIVYPFYVLIIGVFSLFGKFDWKGRVYQK